MSERKWFVIFQGRQIGIFTSPEELAPLVKDYLGAMVEEYDSKDMAEQSYALLQYQLRSRAESVAREEPREQYCDLQAKLAALLGVEFKTRALQYSEEHDAQWKKEGNHLVGTSMMRTSPTSWLSRIVLRLQTQRPLLEKNPLSGSSQIRVGRLHQFHP